MSKVTSVSIVLVLVVALLATAGWKAYESYERRERAIAELKAMREAQGPQSTSGGVLTNPAYLQANSENQAPPDLRLRGASASRTSYSFTVTGLIENRSSRNYSYAQVLFDVYDSSGARVGSAIGNINNLGAGETWSFKAIYLGEGGYRFRLNEISGF